MGRVLPIFTVALWTTRRGGMLGTYRKLGHEVLHALTNPSIVGFVDIRC